MSVKEKLLENNDKNYQDIELNFKEHNLLFTKLNPLISNIKKKNTLIENKDIHDYVPQSTDARQIINDYKKYVQSRKQSPTLWQIYWHISGRNFIWIITLTFLTQAQDILMILLLNELTDILQKYQKEKNKMMIFYMVSMLVCFQLRIFLQVKNDWINTIWQIQTKCSIQYCIFMKALRTKMFSNQEESKDKNKSDDQEPNINNLISVDVDEIMQLAWGFSNCIFALTYIIVLFYILEQQIGDAIYQGLWVILGSSIFNFLCSFSIQISQKYYLQYKDQRISLSTDIIECIKSIKCFSWEKIFQNKIRAIRKKEFAQCWVIRTSDGFLAFFWQSITYLLLFSFLYSYVQKGHKLQDSNIFVIIAIFNLITYPLGILPWSLGCVLNSRISFLRLIRFFNEKEIDSSFIDDSVFFQQYSNQPDSDNIIIKIKNTLLDWPKRQVIQQKKKKKQIEQSVNKSKKNFKLRIDNLEIENNKLTFIIGKIGSGKTALLNGIQNEMEIFYQDQMSQKSSAFNSMINSKNMKLKQIISDQKNITIRGSIGLVSQNNWLQNKSVRENILFGKEYEEKWFNEVIRLCELEQDLQQFKNRDKKLIQQNGSNLSGGQKQRITLARAIYQDCDIYLFDDIFSSLDIHVADSIFHNLVVEFLIKQKGKTILMVTSQYKYFYQSGLQTNLIYLENGRHVKDELQLQNYLNNSQKNRDDNLKLIRKKSSKQEEDLKNRHLQEIQNKNIDADDLEEEKNEEHRIFGQISKKTYLSYLQDYGWISVYGIFLFSMFMSGAQSLIDYWLKDQISINKISFFRKLNDYFGNDFERTFIYLIIQCMIICIFRNFFYVLGSQSAAKKKFDKLNSSLIFSNQKFFDMNPLGRIINRLSNDVLVIDLNIPWYYHVIQEDLVKVLGILVVVSIIFPWIVIIIGFFLMLVWRLIKIYRPVNRDMKRLNSVNQGKVMSLLSEACNGLQVIRCFKKQQMVEQEYVTKLFDATCSDSLISANYIWFQVRLLLTASLLFSATLLSAFIIIMSGITYDYSSISLSITYSFTILGSFCSFMNQLMRMEQDFVSIERVRQYEQENQIENLEQIKNISRNIDQQDTIQNIQNTLQNFNDYSIIFSNVSLSYDNNKTFALKDFNLYIKKGEKIAICGRTGSGKSSILNILFRLYEIQQGNIIVNQQQIYDITLHDLRKQIKIIPQFGFLFKATLKDNIDPQENYTQENIMDIVRKTGLVIRGNDYQQNQQQQEQEQYQQQEQQQEQIQQQEMDLNMQIEDGGKNLSNGEKQIINFLRILINEQEIICLDEATSNMDPETDHNIHQNLFKLTQNKTLITITHRLENIDQYDRVIVMDQGKIIQQSTGKEVTAKKQGFFNIHHNN